MTMDKVIFWKESASEAFAQNGVKNNEFSFEVTSEQKEYLEEGHLKELDNWCYQHFKMIPDTVRFEPFHNGVEDVYTCECYF